MLEVRISVGKRNNERKWAALPPHPLPRTFPPFTAAD